MKVKDRTDATDMGLETVMHHINSQDKQYEISVGQQSGEYLSLARDASTK